MGLLLDVYIVDVMNISIFNALLARHVSFMLQKLGRTGGLSGTTRKQFCTMSCVIVEVSRVILQFS